MRQLPEGAPILPATAMRAAEERAFAAGVSQEALMERAGLAVARAARRFSGDPPIVVLAGPGNNGGDAYVAARHLAEWGHDVTLFAFGEPRGQVARRMAAEWGGEARRFDAAAVPDGAYLLIDGLFGTGATRALVLDDAHRAMFAGARWRVAIDVPSGIDSDSGADLGCPAPMTMTVALGALKPAHAVAPDACGTVLLDDLGLDVASDWRVVAQPGSLRPKPADHKYRALVTIVAGAMPGAARLAAHGAVGAGAGYVMLVGGDPAGPLDAIVRRPADALDEVLADDRGILVVGPGLGRDARAKALLDAAIASPRTLLLDGDALSLLGRDAARRLRGRARTILTPHEGEFARMFGEGAGGKIARTLAAAADSGATIVHKGAVTVVAAPDGALRVSTAGPSWLATAGTGDVLAGAIAARGSPEDGVWLHARAATLAGAAFSADRLADLLPLAVAECR